MNINETDIENEYFIAPKGTKFTGFGKLKDFSTGCLKYP